MAFTFEVQNFAEIPVGVPTIRPTPTPVVWAYALFENEPNEMPMNDIINMRFSIFLLLDAN
jgi:hypothetical protein